MMLRCTSAVPPPMVSAGAKRYRSTTIGPVVRRSDRSPHGPVLWSMPRAPVRSRASAITCWPCSSASALRTEASGPGCRPAHRGRDGAQAQQPQHLALRPQRGQALPQQGVGGAAGRRTMSTRSAAVGPIPHSAPAPDSETRSLPRVTLASDHPSPLLADQVLGRKPHLVEEHLVERVGTGHVDDGAHRHARARPSGR